MGMVNLEVWGFQFGCRLDGSCKVFRVLVSSIPQLTEVWGFRTGCRPDGSCKVSRVLVSSTPKLTEFGGCKPGIDLIDSVKSRELWFLLLRS